MGRDKVGRVRSQDVRERPDVAVVVAARAGDPQAVEHLVRACLPLVYNIVGRALDGHSDVDDVVQDTMLRALTGCRVWRNRSGSGPGWSPLPYGRSATGGAVGRPGRSRIYRTRPSKRRPRRRTSPISPFSGWPCRDSAARRWRRPAGWRTRNARCSRCGGWKPPES
ncbi:RNA polymerase sigma factor [Streptomyces sp. NPDC058420]|uniref:RNA polymerase sigma factor n=1 Tax=Streptomyces sp. NPDC058420 TaxID=3346489 RepID=UPI00364AB09D